MRFQGRIESLEGRVCLSNLPPVAVDDSVSVKQDTQTFLPVLFNDSDPDGFIDSSTFAVQDAPAHGTVVLSFGNPFYTPDAGYLGPDSFTYTVADNSGAASNLATVTIDVFPNQPPVAVDDSVSVKQDTQTFLPVLFNDSDPDGSIDSSTFAVVSAPAHGTVVLSFGNPFYTPDAGYLGPDSFTYVVSDDSGAASNLATVTIDVFPNQPPTAGDDSVSAKENTATDISSIFSNDVDPDGFIDTSTFAVVSAPAHGTLDASSGSPIYTPDPGYLGPDSFTYVVSDDSGAASNQATVTIDVVPNQPPTAGDDSVSVKQGTATDISSIFSNDVDPDGSVVFSSFAVVSAPAHGTLDASSGSPIYTPDAGYIGPDSFTYTILDDSGAISNLASVTIDVFPDQPPVAADDAMAADAGIQNVLDIFSNDSDPDDPVDPLSFAVVVGPAHGTIALDTATNSVVYTPDAGYLGPDSLSYTITDGVGLASNVASVSITVGPRLTLTSPTSAGALPSGVTPVGGLVLDLIGLNGVRVVSQLAASSLFSGFFDSEARRPIKGTRGPSASRTGFSPAVLAALGGGLSEASLRVTLFDGDTGPGDFDHGENVLLINGVEFGNFSSIRTEETTGDGGRILSRNLAGGFRNDRTDTGFFLSTDPTVLSAVFASLSGGDVVYKLRDDQNPYDNFFDFTRGVDGGLIDVGSTPNIAPVAADDSASTAAGTPVTIDVLANDKDLDGTLVPSSVAIVTAPANGTVAIDPTTGKITYTPNPGFSGVETFTYTVQDNSKAASTPATVTITVVATTPEVSDVEVLFGSSSYSLIGNTRDLPWTDITAIRVRLANDVPVTVGELSLIGASGSSLTFSHFSYDAATRTAVWTLASPLGPDRIALALDASPTVPGPDFTLNFDVLPGDFNGDGVVTILDSVGVRDHGFLRGAYLLFADLDGDGVVDLGDLNAPRRRLGSRLP